MTFGKIKSLIERNLLESYGNEKDFKRILKEFKYNVLRDKNLSKIYSIYDQLSTPQGLKEQEAKDFLQEGVNLLKELLPSVKLPKTIDESVENKYQKIDVLVYTNKVQLSERIECRREVLNTLMSPKVEKKDSINIPIKTMVNVANQTLRTYLDGLDETTKKEIFKLISEDSKKLETEFQTLKESAMSKLTKILENENESEMKDKITETIDRIKSEKFDQVNFMKMKSLVDSI